MLETERARRSGGAAAAGRACVLEPLADSVLTVAVPPAPCRGVPAGVLPRAGGRSCKRLGAPKLSRNKSNIHVKHSNCRKFLGLRARAGQLSGSSTPQGRRDESNSLATSLQNPSSLPIKLPEPRTHLADGPQPVQSMSPKVSSNWTGRAGPVRVFAVARLGLVDLVNSENSKIEKFRNSRNSQSVLYRHRQCALIPKIPKM